MKYYQKWKKNKMKQNSLICCSVVNLKFEKNFKEKPARKPFEVSAPEAVLVVRQERKDLGRGKRTGEYLM